MAADAGHAAAHAPRVDPLYTGLVDDAGLFPPAELPMALALRRHRDDEESAHPTLTHRFVLTLDHAESFAADVRASGARLSVVVRSDALDRDVRLGRMFALLSRTLPQLGAQAVAVEMRLTPDEVVDGTLASIARVARDGGVTEMYAETGLDDLDRALQGLSRLRVRAKVRCGGLRADLFPTPEQLAGFVVAAHRHAVPWKATAGLHHAVRSRDERDGLLHHGFLNLMGAAALAARGADTRAVAALLDETGTAAVVRSVRLDDDAAHEARQAFVSFGSCETHDPIADLEALELIPPATPDRS